MVENYSVRNQKHKRFILLLHPDNCYTGQVNMFFVVDFVSNPYGSCITVMITYKLLQILCSASSSRWTIDIGRNVSL